MWDVNTFSGTAEHICHPSILQRFEFSEDLSVNKWRGKSYVPSAPGVRTFFLKRDLISRRSSPVKSLWSNVRHVPRRRLSYSIGTPVEAASAAFRAEMSAGGASVCWMASS